MKCGPLHHLAIKVRDLAACERFYREELGLPLLQRHADDSGRPRSVWLDLGGGAILMLERAGAGATDDRFFSDDAPGLHLFALRIDRADRARLAARLSVVAETKYTIYVRDPEGNRIGLSHFPEELLP